MEITDHSETGRSRAAYFLFKSNTLKHGGNARSNRRMHFKRKDNDLLSDPRIFHFLRGLLSSVFQRFSVDPIHEAGAGLLRPASSVLPAQQVLLNKQNSRVEKKILVFLFGVTMAFIVRHQEPGLNSIALQLVQHLA
jgi:hypothetical protein